LQPVFYQEGFFKTMSENQSQPNPSESPEQLELKQPALAGFLAWLFPGLGHLYQKRYGKAILYFICIMGTFLYGCYLGSDRQFGTARVVYYSWKPGDKRLYFFAQAGLGIATIPALIQANRAASESPPLWGGAFAPPRTEFQEWNDQPTLDMLVGKMHRFFELGTIYTVIAGLMNVLAIFDAIDGPVWLREDKKDAKKSKKEEEDATAEEPDSEEKPPKE
jgi:TM2 domain-containing membrane protein YozV